VVSPGAQCCPAVHFCSLKHTQKFRRSETTQLRCCSTWAHFRRRLWPAPTVLACRRHRDWAECCARINVLLLFGPWNLTNLPHLLLLPLPLLSVCSS
jgi:hypothetical protein